MARKNNLIHEITESLYSSLDLERSLHETLLLLKEYMPLDLVHVFTLNKETKKIEYLAEATIKKGVLIDEEFVFTDEQMHEFSNIGSGEVFKLNRLDSPALRFIHEEFQKKRKFTGFTQESDFSAIVIGFDIVPPLLGGFGMVSNGNNVFKKEHEKVMEFVKRPLIGAVLNLLHHRDVVKKNQQLLREKEILKSSLKKFENKEIIGSKSGLKNVFQMIERVTGLNSPVVIFGETGTGKELVANEIHRSSGRFGEKIVRVNCGAIPETLMESELFGHEKGSFTGAGSQKNGFFEQADKGTIFLDEIAELSTSAQVKLLRVLQTMEFHRVGGNSPVSVDVRVIAATNRDLLKMVREKRFREDLWFRLNVFPIFIPPLRERVDDIEMLAKYFIEKKVKEMNLEVIPGLSKTSLNILKGYHWPGNVRELENIVERALIIGRGENLSFDDLILKKKDMKKDFYETDKNFPSMEEAIKNHIRRALKITDCKIEGQNGAAKLLNMNPSTLRSRMKKLNIEFKKGIKNA